MANGAVVGGHLRIREQGGSQRVLGGPEAEQHARAGAQLVREAQERRGADPSAYQERLLRRARIEADAERADQSEPLPWLEPGEPRRSGPDRLQEELQSAIL